MALNLTGSESIYLIGSELICLIGSELTYMNACLEGVSTPSDVGLTVKKLTLRDGLIENFR
jgi:hypothetical protein